MLERCRNIRLGPRDWVVVNVFSGSGVTVFRESRASRSWVRSMSSLYTGVSSGLSLKSAGLALTKFTSLCRRTPRDPMASISCI